MEASHIPTRQKQTQRDAKNTKTLTPALASQIYNVQKSSLPTASYNVKLIWDQHWHMGNQSKAATTVEDYYKDSQQQQCQAATLPKTRSDYITQINFDILREERATHHKTVA